MDDITRDVPVGQAPPSVLWLRSDERPTPENVAAVLELRPDAARLLADWESVWTQSLGQWSTKGNETDGDTLDGWIGTFRTKEAWHLLKGAPAPETSGSGETDTSTIGGWRHLVDAASMRIRARELSGYQHLRDWRLHVVDSAEAIVSLASARPGTVLIASGRDVLRLVGHRDDGLPILEKADAWSSFSRPKAEDCAYWQSPSFLRHAGRRFTVCRDLREVASLLDSMATEGGTRAFLKGSGSKTGTWTVPIGEGISSLRSVCTTLGPSAKVRDVVVQDHVPFTHEQRFFVVRGRIAASVASHRDHCSLDGREDRILDERVARIERPEIGKGLFDRGRTSAVVDRKLAAAFARKARIMVRELTQEGRFDYVLDMGLSERGILPVELNELLRSGPYGLRRSRMIRSLWRDHDALAASFQTTPSSTPPGPDDADEEAYVRGMHDFLGQLLASDDETPEKRPCQGSPVVGETPAMAVSEGISLVSMDALSTRESYSNVLLREVGDSVEIGALSFRTSRGATLLTSSRKDRVPCLRCGLVRVGGPDADGAFVWASLDGNGTENHVVVALKDGVGTVRKILVPASPTVGRVVPCDVYMTPQGSFDMRPVGSGADAV